MTINPADLLTADLLAAAPLARMQIKPGIFAIVDSCDVSKLKGYTWHVVNGYASTSITVAYKKRRTLKMHQLLIDAPTGMQIDHINGDRLDNRRCNLRVCTPDENRANRGLNRNSTSRYKGVSWNKDNKKWHARISINGIRKHIGYYITPEAAAAAYNEAIKKYNLPFFRPNALSPEIREMAGRMRK